MSEFRCFNTFNQSNLSSSDYLKKKKRTAIFTNAQTIAIGNSNYQKGITENSIPPGYLQKESGGETFFNPVYIDTTGGNRCLLGAHSYDVLYDVLYGAKPNNELVKDIYCDVGIAPQMFFKSQGSVGTIMQIDFMDANGSSIGPAISAVPDGSGNKMYYQPRQDFVPEYNDPDGNPPKDFPGMIVDPCYNIFYPQCSVKYRPNNYLKNIKFNSKMIRNSISKEQAIRFIENKLYQNVTKFPYPLDFSATRCLSASDLPTCPGDKPL